MKIKKPFFAHDLTELYERHRLQFLAIERERHAPRYEGAALEHRFTDSKGRAYYGFASLVDLPLERYARMREFLAWLAAGLTGEEVRKLVDAADAALAAGIKNGKNAAKIGLVLTEMRERSELVLHHELLIHFLAVQLIRQDERPEVFDGTLHREKVTDLLAESSGGHPFFFSTRWPELKKLHETFNWSNDEWTAFWNVSQARVARLEHVLRTASPVAESPS